MRQDRATVFRAPHDVMLQRKHRSGVLCVSIPHSEAYMSGAYLFQLPGIALARDPAFRCRRRRQSPAGGHDGITPQASPDHARTAFASERPTAPAEQFLCTPACCCP
jgi:hypothetical protein